DLLEGRRHAPGRRLAGPPDERDLAGRLDPAHRLDRSAGVDELGRRQPPAEAGGGPRRDVEGILLDPDPAARQPALLERANCEGPGIVGVVPGDDRVLAQPRVLPGVADLEVAQDDRWVTPGGDDQALVVADGEGVVPGEVEDVLRRVRDEGVEA